MSNRGKHCHQSSGKAAGTQPTGKAAKGQRGQRPGAVILQGLLSPPVPSQLMEKIKQNPPSAGSTRFSGCTLPSLPDSWLLPSLEKQGLLSGFQTTRGRCRGPNLRPGGGGCPGSCHCHPAGATPAFQPPSGPSLEGFSAQALLNRLSQISLLPPSIRAQH